MGRPNVYGAAINTSTSATLAAMDASGLTIGTQAWNADVEAYFKLTVSTADLVPDEVVAVSGTTGARWIIVQSGGSGDVFTDETLTGDGTEPDPLGVNPITSRGPDWIDYMRVMFQQKTGLDPIAIAASAGLAGIVQEFSGQSAGSVADVDVAGAGAAVNFLAVASCARFTGPNASTAGKSVWAPGAAAASCFPYVSNVRTKRWMVAFRIAISSAPVAGNLFRVGMLIGGSTLAGIGYNGNQATWWYLLAGHNFDTEVAIDSTGAVFLNAYVANFDLTNVVVSLNGGTTDIDVGQAADLASSSGIPTIRIDPDGSQAAAALVDVDCITCIYER